MAPEPSGNTRTAKSEVDLQLDKIQSEVTNKIEQEMQKALGSLNGRGALPAGDLAKLQATAAEMMKKMNKQSEATSKKEESVDQKVALTADSNDPFPIPENCSSKSVEGTKYFEQVDAIVKASTTRVESLYRTEFEKRGLKEKKIVPPVKHKMVYTNAEEMTEVTLSGGPSKTTIALTFKNNAAAKADKMIATQGKGLVLLGNLSQEVLEVSLAGKKFVLNAEQGAKDPKDSMRVELAPGSYKVEWKSKGGKSWTETLELAENTTWGAIYDDGFQAVMRLY